MKVHSASFVVAVLFASVTLSIQPSAQADTWGGGTTNEFTIDFVGIGNAGNAADTTTYGAVPYETFDQGGNVSEWNDAVIGSSRGVRGSAWYYLEDFLQSSSRGSNGPTNASSHVGFRVASVPEPSTYALLLLAGAGWLLWRRRKAYS